jgi:hypothetical protein
LNFFAFKSKRHAQCAMPITRAERRSSEKWPFLDGNQLQAI